MQYCALSMDAQGGARRGRPRIEIDVDRAEYFLNIGRTLVWIADHFEVLKRMPIWHSVSNSSWNNTTRHVHVLQCSEDTLHRRLQAAGIAYRHKLSTEQLLSEIHEAVHLTENGRAYGHRPAYRCNLQATNTDILDALRYHDPGAVTARQERIIHRRTYNITEGMVLWHMDSKPSPPDMLCWFFCNELSALHAASLISFISRL